MLQIPEISIRTITEFLLGGVVVVWEMISAVDIIKAKLHVRTCMMCGRPVSPDEQAAGVPAPLHIDCQFKATLLARKEKPEGQ